jgi:hypothetical protein
MVTPIVKVKGRVRVLIRVIFRVRLRIELGQALRIV